MDPSNAPTNQLDGQDPESEQEQSQDYTDIFGPMLEALTGPQMVPASQDSMEPFANMTPDEMDISQQLHEYLNQGLTAAPNPFMESRVPDASRTVTPISEVSSDISAAQSQKRKASTTPDHDARATQSGQFLGLPINMSTPNLEFPGAVGPSFGFPTLDFSGINFEGPQMPASVSHMSHLHDPNLVAQSAFSPASTNTITESLAPDVSQMKTLNSGVSYDILTAQSRNLKGRMSTTPNHGASTRPPGHFSGLPIHNVNSTYVHDTPETILPNHAGTIFPPPAVQVAPVEQASEKDMESSCVAFTRVDKALLTYKDISNVVGWMKKHLVVTDPPPQTYFVHLIHDVLCQVQPGAFPVSGQPLARVGDHLLRADVSWFLQTCHNEVAKLLSDWNFERCTCALPNMVHGVLEAAIRVNDARKAELRLLRSDRIRIRSRLQHREIENIEKKFQKVLTKRLPVFPGTESED